MRQESAVEDRKVKITYPGSSLMWPLAFLVVLALTVDSKEPDWVRRGGDRVYRKKES